MSILSLLRSAKSRVAPKLVLNRTLLDRHIGDILAEKKAIQAAYDRLLVERNNLLAEKDRELELSWLCHRPANRIAGDATVTTWQRSEDAELVNRIRSAYRAANTTPLGAPDSFWLQTIADIKRDIHDTLMKGNEDDVGAMLRKPSTNMLFYGFDTLTKTEANPKDPGWQEWVKQRAYDNLLRLAEAIGIQPLEYPEGPTKNPPIDPETLLQSIDSAFGFKVEFPNPFPDEVGLATSRGVASYRAVQALFQAFRISQLVGDNARVVEIGGGLGRTAFYALQFGVRDYTIIDLPMTNVAQGYFLGRTLGQHAISLFGENRAGVRILPPTEFLDASDRYDLAVNVDSLTEMSRDTAVSYCTAIHSRAGKFLSINHEYNPFTVQEICSALGMHAWARAPYWLRRGYVEEVFNLMSQTH
jgi:hypothetical protein